MHALLLDGSSRPLTAAVDVARAGGRALLRVLPLASLDAVVVAAAPATRDGRELVGRLAVVDAGVGAVFRAAGLRAELCWQPAPRRRPAQAGEECRLCFGACAAGEEAVACACGAPFHPECRALCVTCPGCGERAGEVPK
jgi:hypothetical protein